MLRTRSARLAALAAAAVVTGMTNIGSVAGAAVTAPVPPRATLRCSPTSIGDIDCAVAVFTSNQQAPSGPVRVAATGAPTATCNLVEVGSEAAGCGVLLVPTAAGNASNNVITASYTASTGDATSPSITVTPVVATVVPRVAHTYLGGSGKAGFGVTLSRPSNTTTTLHFTAEPGTGAGAETSAKLGYVAQPSTLVIPPRATTGTAWVPVYATVLVRGVSNFRIASSAVGAYEPAASRVATETVATNLEAGQIASIHLMLKGKSVAGAIYLRRYGAKTYIRAVVGTVIYAGDTLFTTPHGGAGIYFGLGAAVNGVGGESAHVASTEGITFVGETRYRLVSHTVEGPDKAIHGAPSLAVATRNGQFGPV
jgi:hypothetical protein